MLHLKNGEWTLCPYKVKYKQRGEKREAYTEDKDSWIDFAKKWDHTEIIEFNDVEYTEEQIKRLEDIQNVKEGFEYYAGRYVLDGEFPDELEDDERLKNHPMKALQNKKENESHGQAITEEQLSNMDLGRKQTDMELRIMELESEAE